MSRSDFERSKYPEIVWWYRSIRSSCALLRQSGVSDPERVPLGLLWMEAGILIEQANHRMASEAILVREAVSSIMSTEAGQNFNDLIERLTNG